MTLDVTPMSPYVGAELRGIDLEKPLTKAQEKEIWDAWIQYGVIVFPEACESTDAHIRISHIFGELEPAATTDLNDDKINVLMNLRYQPNPDGSRGRGMHWNVDGQDVTTFIPWHWDQSFMPTIVRGAVLRAIEPAAEQGMTGFICAIAAYDRLSEATKKRIEGREVVYNFVSDFRKQKYGQRNKLTPILTEEEIAGIGARYNDGFPPVVHPLVITQRETGRKVLKISPLQAQYIFGMEPAESEELLAELADTLTDERYAHFYKWRKNDLLVWDNWRVIHKAQGLPLTRPRFLQRTTIMGDYKVGRYLDPVLEANRPTDVMRFVD